MKKLFSTNYSAGAFNFAMFILRVATGVMMMPHGYSKLKNFSSMSKQFADPFHLGMTTSLSLTIFAELFCAGLLVLGLLTRFACIPLIIVMSVALFMAHNGDIFGKGEMAGLFLAIFITILFVGPGKFSVDGLIGK